MPQTLLVGREPEQREYQQLFTRATPWMLIITGMGGIGKSTLLRLFIDQTPQQAAIVTLNFTNIALQVDPLTILSEFSRQFAPYCDLQQNAALEKTLTEGRARLVESSVQMSQQIIATGDAADIQLSILSLAPEMLQRRRQVRERVTRALYHQMDTFHAQQLVIMLDSCEWLNEPEHLEVSQWLLDDFLPSLHGHLQQKGCQNIVVIASRTLPRINVIDEYERKYLALQMLDRNATDHYLDHIGMHDVALRERVYELTHGYPLAISIIGALWLERGEQPFTLADLPKLQEQFTERALLEFVRERVLSRLKSPFRELTRYGVLLHSFDLPLLQAVFPELLSGADALDIFHKLTTYPYVERRGNHHYAFHDLLREIQAAEVREQEPEKWKMYHKRALDYLTLAAPHTPDWYYHAIADDEEQGMSSWLDAIQEAQVRGISAYWGALLQAVYDSGLELSLVGCAERAFYLGNFYYYQSEMPSALGSYEEALRLFQQAEWKLGEANARKAIGDVQQFRDEWLAAFASYEQALILFRQVGSKLGEANAWKAMGDVQQFLKDMQTALTSYEQALTLYRMVGSKLGEANVLQAMGDVQQFRKDMQAALASYEQALSLFRQVGAKLGEAIVLQAMGDVQQFRDEREAALASYEQALSLFRQVGAKLGEANVRKAMGDVQQFRKDMQAALASYEQALSLFRQVGDRLGEANVLQAIGDVQQFRKDMQAALASYEQALSLFRQVGAKLGEANVLQAMGDVQQFRDDREAALASYEQALTLYRQVGAKLGEANVRKAMGDVQQFRDDQEAVLASYEQALILYRQVGDRLGEANCYLAQGRVALVQEDYQKALTLHTSAYQLYQQIQDRYSQVRSLYYRSFVYAAMNETSLAIQDMENALITARAFGLPFVELLEQRYDSLHENVE